MSTVVSIAIFFTIQALVAFLVLRVRPILSKLDSGLPHRVPVDQKISVIIPARNEEQNLPLLLSDLRQQSLSPFEIIVVDDDSTDSTPAIAAAAADTVYRVDHTPAGWNPKVWALVSGVEKATGDVLVFLDCDVRLDRKALLRLVRAVEVDGGLVSVAPYHETDSAVEALSVLCNIIAIIGGGPGFGRGSSQGAVGSCIAISANDYKRIGGHRATPATIVDDMSLAATAAAHDLPVTLYRGRDVVSTRSYPDGLRQIIAGWTKNLAAGAQRTKPTLALVVGAWLALLLQPIIHLADGRYGQAAFMIIFGNVHLLLLSTLVGRFDRRMILGGGTFVALFLTAVTALSFWRSITGGTTDWKGRGLTSDGLEPPLEPTLGPAIEPGPGPAIEEESNRS